MEPFTVNKAYRYKWQTAIKCFLCNTIPLICIDPPYEIGIYAKPGYTAWLTLFESIHKILKPEGNFITFAGWSILQKVLDAGEVYFDLHNIIAYDRQKTKNGGKHNLTSALEFIVWFTKKGVDKPVFHKEDSDITKVTKGYGRKNDSIYRRLSNVWIDISPLHYRSTEYTGYKCQKPLKLMRRIVRVFSNPGDLVIDFFCGSGSCLEAAVTENRTAIGFDSNQEAITLSNNRIRKII